MEILYGHAWCYFIYRDKYGKKHKYGVDATYGDMLEGDEELTISYKIRNNFATKSFMKNHDFVNCFLFDQEPIEGNYDGYEDSFIMRFLYLVNNDINIRPETLYELETKHKILLNELISLKDNNPKLFNGSVESNLNLIINECRKSENLEKE